MCPEVFGAETLYPSLMLARTGGRRTCFCGQVYRLAYNGDVVAFKWATGKAVRAGLAVEGAYLNRYVTDEQRSRRPIFNATLRAAASWLFFRVARSTRMTQIWALYR